MHRSVSALPVLSISLLALASSATAEVVSDDSAKITVGAVLQTRMDIGRGSSVLPSTGVASSYAPSEGIVGEHDDADFSLRRLRLVFKGTYQDFIFQVQLQGDNIGKNTTAGTTAGTNTVGLYDAWAGKRFINGAVGQQITAGLQTAAVQLAQFRGTTTLFPTNRAAAGLFSPRGVGVAYRMEAPVLSLGVDVQNNIGDDATAGVQDTKGEGLVYDARIQLTGVGEWAAQWQESFAGKPGHGFVIGLDLGVNKHDRLTGIGTAGTTNGSVDSKLLGIEAVLHVEGLSALVYDRHLYRDAVADPGTGVNPNDVAFARHQSAMGIQAGYAFPFMGWMLEPAARYEWIDNNVDVDGDGTGTVTAGSAKNFGTGEFGTSGRQIELGLNLYFNGHKNKLCAEFMHWEGESPTDIPGASTNGSKPTANIIRVQHQLAF